MTTLNTFKATRGRLQDYGDPDAVLELMVCDETVIDHTDPLIVKATDIDAGEIPGYTRPTLTGISWDTTPEIPVLRADDALVEGLNVPGPSPLVRYVITVCADHPDTDRIGDLVSIVTADPFTCVGDLPVEWPGGVMASIEEGEGAGVVASAVLPLAIDEAGELTLKTGPGLTVNEDGELEATDGGGGGAVGIVEYNRTSAVGGWVEVDLSGHPAGKAVAKIEAPDQECTIEVTGWPDMTARSPLLLWITSTPGGAGLYAPVSIPAGTAGEKWVEVTADNEGGGWAGVWLNEPPGGTGALPSTTGQTGKVLVVDPDEEPAWHFVQSDAVPQPLGTAAAGTGTGMARDDHVHEMPTASDVGADPAGSAAAAQAAAETYADGKVGWSYARRPSLPAAIPVVGRIGANIALVRGRVYWVELPIFDVNVKATNIWVDQTAGVASVTGTGAIVETLSSTDDSPGSVVATTATGAIDLSGTGQRGAAFSAAHTLLAGHRYYATILAQNGASDPTARGIENPNVAAYKMGTSAPVTPDGISVAYVAWAQSGQTSIGNNPPRVTGFVPVQGAPVLYVSIETP